MKINRESGYVQLPSGRRGFGSRTGPTPRIVKLLFFGALVYLWGIGNEVSVWSSPAPAGFLHGILRFRFSRICTSREFKSRSKSTPFSGRRLWSLGRSPEPFWAYFAGLIHKLGSLRHKNVFAFGRAFREFAIRAQYSVKFNWDRISLGPEFARLEIGQQIPQNSTRLFKGELNRVHTE
jgi:hypothetical protein